MVDHSSAGYSGKVKNREGTGEFLREGKQGVSASAGFCDVRAAHPAYQQGNWIYLGSLLIALLAVKLTLYLLDPRPKFLLGDSGSYIYTALSGWIPEDRSFTYGFLLRALALWPHSFTPLVLFQTCISGIAAWIVSLSLIRYFKARFWIAAFCGLLCAIEPLQLISERFILTEAVSTFLFAIYVILALEYLKSGRLVILVVAQVISVPLISLRISFLPLVLTSSVLLPLLGPQAKALWVRLWKGLPKKSEGNFTGNSAMAKKVAVHLLIAVVLSQLCLYGYRRGNGALSKHPPAYSYNDGVFLLCFWAPIVQPGDFPIPEWRSAVFKDLHYDLHNPTFRNIQCYAPDGLLGRMSDTTTRKLGYSDSRFVNKLAKKTALRAVKRDPIGLLKLSAHTYAEFFDTPYLQSTAEIDEGFHNPGPPEFRRELLTNFREQYDGEHLDTLTLRWHMAAIHWYQFLMLVPFLFTLLAFFAVREYTPQWIYFGVAIWGFTAQSIVVTVQPTVRYLTAAAWLSFLILGAVAVGVARNRRQLHERSL
jgi:hypothetical protein